MNMDIGNQSKSDNKFTAKYRLHQSKYRAEVLQEEQGTGATKNSKSKYGNMLINGEETGSNFISKAAFEYAKQRVKDKKSNKALTIDDYRLFNNMLSSMPMAFNLFSDLRYLLKDSPESASSITKKLFPELPWVSSLKHVEVEFIPIPIKDYTNDKSAFDAMLITEDEKGRKGLISIETKYTDILGGNVSADSVTKNALVEQGNFFSDTLKKELQNNGYKQIHRNFLLTYAYANKNKFRYFANIVISPAEDKLSVEEIETLKSDMTKHQGCIFKISLEDIVERGCNCSNPHFSKIMEKFKKRYILTD